MYYLFSGFWQIGYSVFCLEVKQFLPISITSSLWLLFMHGLLKNFPDYKNFPCSNATTLQGVLGLWGQGGAIELALYHCRQSVH
jgi:hypothetical protein